jgi:hypothetical protein
MRDPPREEPTAADDATVATQTSLPPPQTHHITSYHFHSHYHPHPPKHRPTKVFLPAPTSSNNDTGIFRRSSFNDAWQNATIILITPATLPSANCYYYFNGTGSCAPGAWIQVPCGVDQPQRGSFDTLITIDTKGSVGILAGPTTTGVCSYFEVVIKVAGGNTVYYAHIPMSGVSTIEVLPEIRRIDVIGQRVLTTAPAGGQIMKFRAYGVDLPEPSAFTAGTATLTLNMSAIPGISPAPACNSAFVPASIVNSTDGSGGLEVSYSLPSYVSGCKIDVFRIAAPSYGAITAPIKSVIYMYSTVPAITPASTPVLALPGSSLSISGTDLPLPSSYADVTLSVASSGGNCAGVPSCSSLTAGTGGDAMCSSNLLVLTGDAPGGCLIYASVRVFPNTPFNLTFPVAQIATGIKSTFNMPI